MTNGRPTIVVDLDNTISKKMTTYDSALVNTELVTKLRQYKEIGYDIIIHTARNMGTYNGDISKIQFNTLPIIVDWLKKNNVPCDGVITGKPWCGENGFYIDDRAIRPSEFTSKSNEEILELLNNENNNSFG